MPAAFKFQLSVSKISFPPETEHTERLKHSVYILAEVGRAGGAGGAGRKGAARGGGSALPTVPIKVHDSKYH